MAASLAIPETSARNGRTDSGKPRVQNTAILAAPMLLIAVCFAGGAAVSHWFWLLPAHLLVGLALIFPLTTIATFRAPRLAIVAAALLGVILGFFCSEVQPQSPLFTPLERIAFSTPASTPAIRPAGIATTHVVSGFVIRTTALRLIESFAPTPKFCVTSTASKSISA